MNKEHQEYQYLNLLKHILENGIDSDDRTGVGTLSVFGYQMRFDLQKGFPLLTTKKIFWKGVVGELLFFLGAHTNNEFLVKNSINIWTPWADKNGNLGPIYGWQWRRWGGKYPNIVQPKPICPTGKTTVYGVGDRGDDYVKGIDPIMDKLLIVWQCMLARCYRQDNDNYSYYGKRGVYVDNEWLVFTNFAKDVQCLDGWENKLANWDNVQLDKDIIGDGFCYGPKSCMWVSREENIQAAKYTKIYIIKHKDGREIAVKNPKFIYESEKINQGNFCAMLRGDRKAAGGWSLVKTIDPTEGFDQIAHVIKEIKQNPNSRRLIVNSWNVDDLHRMALPPCHVQFQFRVLNNKLHCQLYQRSADVFIGSPFNIASYALLTHMIAHITGLNVGEFIYTIGDAHIYKNHIEQVRLQLDREPRQLPNLWLDPNIKDIDSFDFASIKIEGYDPHPHIKAEVAV